MNAPTRPWSDETIASGGRSRWAGSLVGRWRSRAPRPPHPGALAALIAVSLWAGSVTLLAGLPSSGTSHEHVATRPPNPTPTTTTPARDDTPAAPTPPAEDPALPPASTPAAAAASVSAVDRLPRGKGMWIHYLERAEGGDPAALVARATAAGLTHVFVRLGSPKTGFSGKGDLARLLPAAHAAGLQVVGWDFPFLDDPAADAARGAEEIAYRTPDGHGVDAFTADIETGGEGVNLTAAAADAYGEGLRRLVGPEFPLIATVPKPTVARAYPYTEVTRHFDAIAPMVYWLTGDPVADVVKSIDALAPLGKPILPIGQAYDGAVDGWPGGAPSKDAIARFIAAASSKGVRGLSFWVWHHATADQWAAITEARQFDPPPPPEAATAP